MKKIFKLIRTIGLAAFGVPRAAQFAVTNRCHGRCRVCRIWRQKEKYSVSREDGLSVIDSLSGLGVLQVTFTGGEPLLNPHIYEFIRRARRHHMYASLCVGDPRLLTENNLLRLKECGPVLISLSYDTDDPDLNAEMRGIPEIHGHFARAVETAVRHDLTLVAAPTITEYTWDRIPEILKSAEEMGFSYINISYPTQSLSRTFQIGGEGTSDIDLKPEQITHGLRSLLAHVRSGNSPFVINPPLSIHNMIRFLEDPAEADYDCLGGWKVFAVDWHCDVYPCWRSDRKLGNILDPDFKLSKSRHNACTMSWFRDFSVVLQDGGRTALGHWRAGNFGRLRKLLH